MPTLTDVTNATGYVTFQNATAGSYTFKIIREGYAQMNETINYNGQPLALSIALSNNNANSKNSGKSLIIIVVVAVAAVAVAVISSLYMMRRRKSPNVKNLQLLQKEMKSKFET